MRALVTGAGGFAGRHLIRHLQEQGDEVFAGCIHGESSVEEAEAVRLDVADAESCKTVISSLAPEVIYHLAGVTFVPEAENDFNLTLSVNVAGTHNVVRTCHLLRNGSIVVVVSSSEVYGKIDPSDVPLTESTPLRPVNNYSMTKVMAELVAERYARAGEVRCVVMRPFNHIGSGQDPRFVASSFAQQLALIARGKAPRQIMVGNLNAARDFSDVRDIVRGYRLAAVKGSGTPYNLSSGRALVVRDLLDRLIQISSTEVEVVQDEERLRLYPGDSTAIYGSFKKAEEDLGWRPQIQLDATLETIYRYWFERV